MRRVTMIGKQFGQLLVTKESGRTLLAKCVCGAEKEFLRGNVLAGYTQSCGCLQKLRTSAANVKHGHKRSSAEQTPTYRSWRAMWTRCTNVLSSNYKWYGGRGIKVAERWKEFAAFLGDMGERPVGTELDRINTAGDYSKENCRWVDHKTNCQNR